MNNNELEFHEFADIFPLLENEALNKLADDMSKSKSIGNM